MECTAEFDRLFCFSRVANYIRIFKCYFCSYFLPLLHFIRTFSFSSATDTKWCKLVGIYQYPRIASLLPSSNRLIGIVLRRGFLCFIPLSLIFFVSKRGKYTLVLCNFRSQSHFSKLCRKVGTKYNCWRCRTLAAAADVIDNMICANYPFLFTVTNTYQGSEKILCCASFMLDSHHIHKGPISKTVTWKWEDRSRYFFLPFY